MITSEASRRPPQTKRWPHVVLGVALVLLLLLAVPLALDQATLVYTLPPTPGTTTPNRHTQLWPAGVGASVLTILALIVALGWLVLSAVRRPPARLWLVPVILAGLALLSVVVASGIETPTF